MRVFVDTSGLLAVLDAADRWHARAAAVWDSLLQRPVRLITTNYVLLEAYALVQRRLGMEAVHTLRGDIEPAMELLWVDAALHRAGVEGLLAVNRRGLSLVDSVSFAAMRQAGISEVLAIDRHFTEQGFRCLPDGD